MIRNFEFVASNQTMDQTYWRTCSSGRHRHRRRRASSKILHRLHTILQNTLIRLRHQSSRPIRRLELRSNTTYVFTYPKVAIHLPTTSEWFHCFEGEHYEQGWFHILFFSYIISVFVAKQHRVITGSSGCTEPHMFSCSPVALSSFGLPCRDWTCTLCFNLLSSTSFIVTTYSILSYSTHWHVRNCSPDIDHVCSHRW